MTNPIDDIENKKGTTDLGRMAANIFTGAKEEADNWADAFWATVAYFVAMFKQGSEPTEEEENDNKT